MANHKRVLVIINPASGGDEPILNTLNDVFERHSVDWDVRVTRQAGDATRFAREGVESGFDIVAGYGGDGTQMEVVNGLLGTEVSYGLLPGGTANAMAFELGIPVNLKEAVEVLCTSPLTQSLDICQAGERKFMLRAYTGPAPEDVASREEKNQLGLLAYPMASMRVLNNLRESRYRIEIDGKVTEDEGLSCFIFNAGAAGGIPARLEDVRADDGYMDLFLVKQDDFSLANVGTFLLKPHLHSDRRLRGRQIKLEVDPPESLWLDGEPAGSTPTVFKVLHQAIRVVVPSV